MPMRDERYEYVCEVMAVNGVDMADCEPLRAYEIAQEATGGAIGLAEVVTALVRFRTDWPRQKGLTERAKGAHTVAARETENWGDNPDERGWSVTLNAHFPNAYDAHNAATVLTGEASWLRLVADHWSVHTFAHDD